MIEFGSLYLRVGLSGESSPRYIINNDINLQQNDDLYLTIKLHELFHKIFVSLLQIKSKFCSVLIVEKFLATKYLRNTILTVLLKDFQVRLDIIFTN